MKGDFTRSTFKAEKHYSSVRMQQGRVQVDADWNEQADITRHRIETEAGDAIGGCGGPLHAAGFHLVTDIDGLTPEERALEGNKNLPTSLEAGDVYVSAGRYYLGGVMAENERILTVSAQPHLPGLEVKDGVLGFGPLLKKILPKENLERLGFDFPEAGKAGVFHAYLDVWQRHITALEDPLIREKALGGPDTATRTQTVWQVKLRKTDDKATCLSPLNLPQSTGRLKAQTKKVTTPPDPCLLPETAGYRGLENQLYRVEIHRDGDAMTATFKWSRENGSVVTRWVGQDKPTALKIEAPGRDEVLGFHTGDWVELTDDLRELWGLPGTLVQVETVEGLTITVKDASKTGTIDFKDFQGNPKIRRWDHNQGGQPKPEEAVLQVEEEKPIDLEQGIQVWFQKGVMYRTGDYWLIPARSATAEVDSGKIEWPEDVDSGGKKTPRSLPRHGIHHHLCGLALLRWDGTKFSQLTDCRPLFPPVTQLISLFYVSGDGQEARPGQRLPHPLRVRIANGQHPVVEGKVAFSIVSGGGALSVSAPVSSTAPDGMAECFWTLGTSGDQRVEAKLLDAAGSSIAGQVVGFNATLSVARDVAYDPTNCAALAEAKAETVQQAIDVLCRTQASRGCCVTVGPGGQIQGPEKPEKLPADAFEKQLGQFIGKDGALCLCILPGTMGLPEGFVFNPERLKGLRHLRITGCGLGSRLELGKPLVFGRLESADIEGVALIAPASGANVRAWLRFDWCPDVRLEQCQIVAMETDAGALLILDGARDIRLVGNELEAYTLKGRGIVMDILADVLRGSVDIDVDRRKFSSAARKISADLAKLGAQERKKLADAIAMRAREAKLASVFLSAFLANLIGDARPRVLAMQLERFRAHEAGVGVAIVIEEADSTIELTGNRLSGALSLYGLPVDGGTLRQDELARVQERFNKGNVQFAPDPGQLVASSNVFTSLVLGERMTEAFRKVKEHLEGMFSTVLLTGNQFLAPTSQLVATHVTLTGNAFEYGFDDRRDFADAVIARSLTVMGNRGLADGDVLRLLNLAAMPPTPTAGAASRSLGAANPRVQVQPPVSAF